MITRRSPISDGDLRRSLDPLIGGEAGGGGRISVFPGTLRVGPPYTVVAGFPGDHECVDPQDLETRYALEIAYPRP